MPQVKEKPTSSVGEEHRDPAVELATELYKNLSMSGESMTNLLSKVKDNEMKTHMTAALCFYEKSAAKVKEFLNSRGAEAKEDSWMARMGARMGITMNTMMDATSSHIAQMVIEGSTMAITESTRLSHRFGKREDCRELVDLMGEWIVFEQKHIEEMKRFL